MIQELRRVFVARKASYMGARSGDRILPPLTLQQQLIALKSQTKHEKRGRHFIPNKLNDIRSK